MVDDDLHGTVATRLRRARQRYTANRRAVVEILEAADHPLTIAELLDGRHLAQSSVYRNLTILTETGVVHRVTSTDEFTRYELAEDLTEHHHHLICSSCGTVEDVPASSRLEQSVQKAADEIARRTGFRTQHHRVDLVGLCARCA